MKAGWQVDRLEQLCDVFADGDWIESKDQSPSGIRLIQTGNVGNGVFKDLAEKARSISEDTFRRLRCTEILEGDCLVSRLPDPVARSCLIPSLSEKCITAVDCTIIRFDRSRIMPELFNYFSQSRDYATAVAGSVGGATRQRISRKNLGLLPIPLPPLEEQRRIVAVLDKAFAGIATATANAQKNLTNARALFESYLQTSLSKNESVGWTRERLGNVATLQRGFDLPTHERLAGKVPLVSSSGVIARVAEAKVLGPGVTTGRSGSIGNVFYIEEEFWPLNTSLYVKSFHGNYPRFVFWLLTKFDLAKYATGSGVPTLNRNFVHDELVWIPRSGDDQKAISKKLDVFSVECGRIAALSKAKLAALSELKQSLLQKAFAGELT